MINIVMNWAGNLKFDTAMLPKVTVVEGAGKDLLA